MPVTFLAFDQATRRLELGRSATQYVAACACTEAPLARTHANGADRPSTGAGGVPTRRLAARARVVLTRSLAAAGECREPEQKQARPVHQSPRIHVVFRASTVPSPGARRRRHRGPFLRAKRSRLKARFGKLAHVGTPAMAGRVPLHDPRSRPQHRQPEAASRRLTPASSSKVSPRCGPLTSAPASHPPLLQGAKRQLGGAHAASPPRCPPR